MRRQVIGLEVVLADCDGTVLDLTTDLRKNNARLDLKHLFIGSSGAFGVVTKAVIEVHPRPAFTSAALLIPRDEDAVMGILAALERDPGGRTQRLRRYERRRVGARFRPRKEPQQPLRRGSHPGLRSAGGGEFLRTLTATVRRSIIDW
jgi:FAD/FMN-containing dehydrogenase